MFGRAGGVARGEEQHELEVARVLEVVRVLEVLWYRVILVS